MECINPIYVRKSHIFVRCGKCLPCLEKRVKEWAVRINADFQKSITAYFVTLTFNDFSLDLYPKLDKSVFQRFLKRLRQYNERGMPDTYKGKKVSKIDSKGQNIKYYACGEYGSKNNRPHWHFVILNLPYDLVDAEIIISEAWKENGLSLGFDHIGVLHEGGINYTLGYMFKNKDKDTIHLMSKKLGSEYMTEKRFDYHRKTLGGYTILSGQKMPLPRYLKNQLYNEKERKEIGLRSLEHITDESLKDPMLKERLYKKLKDKVEYQIKKRK